MKNRCISTEVAGLQFYEWNEKDPDLGMIIRPCTGDDLNLIRQPENPYDENAIRVEWRNGHMLGHVQRGLAFYLAPLMDAGAVLRAYVVDPGDTEPWSMLINIYGFGKFEAMLSDDIRKYLIFDPATRICPEPRDG